MKVKFIVGILLLGALVLLLPTLTSSVGAAKSTPQTQMIHQMLPSQALRTSALSEPATATIATVHFNVTQQSAVELLLLQTTELISNPGLYTTFTLAETISLDGKQIVTKSVIRGCSCTNTGSGTSYPGTGDIDTSVTSTITIAQGAHILVIQYAVTGSFVTTCLPDVYGTCIANAAGETDPGTLSLVVIPFATSN